MLLLDITVVNTALPSIARDLHASFNDLQWVIDAYTLALAAVVLIVGAVGIIWLLIYVIKQITHPKKKEK